MPTPAKRTMPPWSRRPIPTTAVLFGPLLIAKIYAWAGPWLGFKPDLHLSYLVHTQALTSGDYLTPSSIVIAYAWASPIQFAWTANIFMTRPRGGRAGPFAWIVLTILAIASLRAAYVPTTNPGMALDHYSTNSRIVMSSDIIFALVISSANIITSAILCATFSSISAPFRDVKVKKDR